MPYSELLRGRASIGGQIYLVTTVTRDRARLFTNLYLGRCCSFSWGAISVSWSGPSRVERHSRSIAPAMSGAACGSRNFMIVRFAAMSIWERLHDM